MANRQRCSRKRAIGLWRTLLLVGVLISSILMVSASPASATSSPGPVHVSYNSKCLDADLNTINSNGTKIQLWGCNGQSQQSFYLVGDGRTGPFHVSYNGKCLDADLNTINSNGTKIQLWDCNGSQQQSWYLTGDNAAIRSSYNGKCLDADLPTIGSNGTKIQLWDCNGSQQQAWFADSGCQQAAYHCYSVARTPVINNLTGIQGWWHRNYLNSNPGDRNPPTPALTSEMWLTMSNGSWVETGLINDIQLKVPNWFNTCGCQAYTMVWADAPPGGRINYVHYVNNVTPTGQTDTYNIQRGSQANQWDVLMNGNLVGTSTVTGTQTTKLAQIGGEWSGADTAFGRADNFDMYMEESTNGGVYLPLLGWGSTELASRSGMEGTSYNSGSEWSWQKHAPW